MNTLNTIKERLSELIYSEIVEELCTIFLPIYYPKQQTVPGYEHLKQISNCLAHAYILDNYYNNIVQTFINSLSERHSSVSYSWPDKKDALSLDSFTLDFFDSLTNLYPAFSDNKDDEFIEEFSINFLQTIHFRFLSQKTLEHRGLIRQSALEDFSSSEIARQLTASFLILYWFRLSDVLQQKLLKSFQYEPLALNGRSVNAIGTPKDWLSKEYLKIYNCKPKQGQKRDKYLYQFYAITILYIALSVTPKSNVLINLYLLNQTTDLIKIIYSDSLYLGIFSSENCFWEDNPLHRNQLCLFNTLLYYYEDVSPTNLKRAHHIINKTIPSEKHDYAFTLSDFELDLLIHDLPNVLICQGYMLKEFQTITEQLILESDYKCTLDELFDFSNTFNINPLNYMLHLSYDEYLDKHNANYIDFRKATNYYLYYEYNHSPQVFKKRIKYLKANRSKGNQYTCKNFKKIFRNWCHYHKIITQ